VAGRPLRAAKRRAFGMGVLPQGQRTNGAFLPAPVGGLNTTDPAGMMRPTDCLALTNLIPFQYGLRVRSGFYDWFSGLRWTDGSGNKWMDEVRTLIPFNGSADNGARDRFFACTAGGIFDATNEITTGSAYDPTPAVAFPSYGYHNINAGRGISTSYINLNGDHYIAYTDEVHGYFLYSEKTSTWTKVIRLPYNAWAPSTAVTVGTQVALNDLAYECTTSGTTGTTGPAGSGASITDGTAVWKFVPSVIGCDPGQFRYVMQWKNRLWFVLGNSATAVYLDVGAFAGQSYPMPFAPRFKYGGALVGLWSWTLDGGDGVDDLLVGISRGGDIVVYQGTDPALPGAFGLKGVWWAGPVPPGRQVASNFGGDLFVLSTAGCLPLSKLVSGGLIRDPNVYETAKVSNLFNRLMSSHSDLQGWALVIHPTDNLLMINVPGLANNEASQLAMSLASKGWAVQTGLPITCMSTWHGKMFFGTADGRVCVNDGYSDSGTTTTVSGANEVYVTAPQEKINFGMLSAYQNLGSVANKRVHMIRPYFVTDGAQPGYAASARYNYDLTELPLTALAPFGTDLDAWNVGQWNTATWDAGVGVAGRKMGATGMGTVIAVALSGTAGTAVTLVGMDVLMDSGGLL
jgi:hypothetical protein